MKNKEFIQQAVIYLFTPEDSSEMHTMARPGGTSPHLWSSGPSWFGAMKTIMWAFLAIVLPLALITLFF